MTIGRAGCFKSVPNNYTYTEYLFSDNQRPSVALFVGYTGFWLMFTPTVGIGIPPLR